MGRAYGKHGKKRNLTEFCWRNVKERDNFEGLSVDGRKILIWMLKKQEYKAIDWLILLKIGTIDGVW
jgi:hypothetical protein